MYELVSFPSSAPQYGYPSLLDESSSSESLKPAQTPQSTKLHKSLVSIEPLAVFPEQIPMITRSKYVMKTGMWLPSDLEIMDEFGGLEYEVKTKGWIRPDMAGLDVMTGQAPFSLTRVGILPAYDISLYGVKVGTIKIEFVWFGFKANVTFDNGDAPLVVNGGIQARTYTISRGEVEIVKATRKWCQQSYEILTKENHVLIHAIACALNKFFLMTRRYP